MKQLGLEAVDRGPDALDIFNDGLTVFGQIPEVGLVSTNLLAIDHERKLRLEFQIRQIADAFEQFQVLVARGLPFGVEDKPVDLGPDRAVLAHGLSSFASRSWANFSRSRSVKSSPKEI